MSRYEICVALSEINSFDAVKRDEICTAAIELITDVPKVPVDAIGQLLRDAMAQAVENGANSVSMPDHLVEIAVFLSKAQNAVTTDK